MTGNGTRSERTNAVERELKFAVPAQFSMPEFEALPGAPVVVPESTQHLDATYFDTEDLRLARAGITMRTRNDEGWVVKLPQAPSKRRVLTREEVRIHGNGSPPDAAQALVRAVTRSAPLVPVARVESTRQRIALVALDGTPYAEVTDDDVTARPAHGREVHFREVEIEFTDSATVALVDALTDRLRHSGAGEPEPVAKLLRALGPRATQPPDLAPVSHLGARATGADLVRAAIANAATRLVAFDPAVRLGGDPEAVHQARVATRRLRSDLRSLRTFVDGAWSDDLRNRLRDVGAALGAVRDIDVLTDRIERRITELPDHDGARAQPVLERLRDRHERSRQALARLMESPEYTALLDDLVRAAHNPVLERTADQPARGALHAVMQRPWKELAKAVGALGSDPPDPELHRVRILAKRARYAAEAVAPVAGRPARKFARRVAAVQEVLGDHQDAVICAAWLRSMVPFAGPETSFVVGQLVAIERAEAARHRNDWRPAWDRAASAKLRTWW